MNETKQNGSLRSAACSCSPALSVFIRREAPDDSSSERLVNLAVSRHRFRSPALRVVVNVMLATMAQKDASGLLQFLDQLESLHVTSNSSTFLIPGFCS